MKDFELEYDEKAHALNIDHANILKDHAKKLAATLLIKPFQVSVQIAFEKDFVVPDPDPVIDAMQEAADDVALKVFDEIEGLDAKIVKLQKEEKLGNTKAAEEADKEVKAAKKRLDKLAGELGMEVRKAIEAALKKQKVEKPKLRSTSRTGLRGLELNEDAFVGDSGGKVSKFVGEVGKGLAAVGADAFKLSNDEKDSRLNLSDSVKQLKATLDKYIEEATKKKFDEVAVKKGAKAELDIALWARNNVKEVNKMEQTKEKYVDFLKDFEGKLTDVDRQLDKLEKLMDQKALKDNKELAKEIKDFKDSRDTIVGTFAGKLKAASLVDRLFSDDYSSGATFVAAFRAPEAQKGTTKSGKAMQDAGKAIEKITKG